MGSIFCSAVMLPVEVTDTGAPYVSLNFDWMALVLWSEMIGQKVPEGTYHSLERDIVLETRPKGRPETL